MATKKPRTTMPLLYKVALWGLTLQLGTFFAALVLMYFLVQVFRKGPRAVFSVRRRSVPPACMQDPGLGVHGYAHLEEVRLHYVSNGPDDKPLMLLVHGMPEFWYSWRYQLREFSKDYRVVAVDMRGYGDSDKPTWVSDYTLDHLTKDLSQLISALGYEKCVMVGQDCGGVVAWAFALTCPGQVDKLVTINCGSIAAYASLITSDLGQLRKFWYMSLFQMPWIPELMWMSSDLAAVRDIFMGKTTEVRSNHVTEQDIEAYKYTCQRNGFTAPINYYRAIVRYPDVIYGLASQDLKVSCPTLIIHGKQDSTIDLRIPTLSSHSVTGEATVKVIEDCGHFSAMNRPKDVNTCIREFLARAGGST